MKSTYIVVASAVLGSMLAGHAHAQDPCWQTGTCYDGYYDPNDPNGYDYYVDHLDGKWVSTEDYNDYYAGVDPEEYAGLTHFDCWETGTCYDGYFDANDPYGLDYYVDHLDGKWVSTDDYNDYYAGVDPEEYAGLTHFDCWETGTCYDGYFDADDPNGQDYYVDDYYVDDDYYGKWVSTDDYHDYYAGVDPEKYAADALDYSACCYGYMDCGERVDCDSQPAQDWLNENGLVHDQPTPITEPAAPGVNPIPGIGQAAGNVVTHGNDR